VTEFTATRANLQKLSASSVLQKRDAKVIAFETVKDAGAALDFAGELEALQQRMTEAADRESSNVIVADPRRLTQSLTVIERTMLPYEEGLLHDAKEKIAEEEYGLALRLLGELLDLEPQEEAVEAVAAEPPDPAAATPHTVATGKGWARRNDPCPCGSGKKYKRCHGA
jgi:SEC-C motif